MRRFFARHMLAAAILIAGGCALGSFRRGDGVAPANGSSTSTAGAGGEGGSGGSSAVGPGGGSSSSSGMSTCKRATYPAKPQGVGGGGDDIVLAIRKLYLGSKDFQNDFGSPLGLDLDGVCTCDGDGDSCAPPGMQVCDLPNGRDNAIAFFIGVLSNFLPGGNASNFYSQSISEGGWSLLIRLRGYNGMPDDDQVSVALYVASNLQSTPKWDGNDAWPISAASVSNNNIDMPVYVDPNGYVSGGQVVASLPAAEMVIAGSVSQLYFRITGGGLLGTLKQTENGWQIDGGMLLGRIKESDLFYALSSYRNNNGEAFCTTDFIYGQAKQILCNGRDIRTDLASPTAPCNANSFAAGFVASPATIGPITPLSPPSPGCDPSEDPINDSCGN